MDPQKAIDTPTVRVYNQIYDGLLKKDKDMNIVPGLAESWKKIDERKTIFNLRKNVKFHNGETLTAKDVKFTLDRMKNQPTVSFLISEIAVILNEKAVTEIENVVIKSIPEGTNRTIAIIAIGSIEYHGAQAPLGTDYIIPDYIVSKLSHRDDVLTLPPIPY